MTIKEFYEWAKENKVENYPLWNIHDNEKNIEIYPNEFVYITDTEDSNSWLYD